MSRFHLAFQLSEHWLKSMGHCLKMLLTIICFAALAYQAEGGTTWYWSLSSTSTPVDWDRFLATFGDFNFTSIGPWWEITTTTTPVLNTTVTTKTETEGRKSVVKISEEESNDKTFLVIIVVSCATGLIIVAVFIIVFYKLSKSKKYKKTRRLRVKPLKANQAFAPVIHPGLPMGIGMGMTADSMDMPGMVTPMDKNLLDMVVVEAGFAMPEKKAIGI